MLMAGSIWDFICMHDGFQDEGKFSKAVSRQEWGGQRGVAGYLKDSTGQEVSTEA